MEKPNLPTFDRLMNPLLRALRQLGGSGTIEEINSKTIEIARVPNDQLEVLHDPEKSSQTEIEYRLAWTRTYLKKYGVLENSRRGVWALTAKGRGLDEIDARTVTRYVRSLPKEGQPSEPEEALVPTGGQATWRDELMQVLLELEPDAFERLTQRFLREAGFIQVEVTGKSGDGGIDGKGIMRLGGLLSFHVIFQCKRYRGAVSASQVRDFRGAMVGRADKGLLITTGNFTKDAVREATRDGAPAIDLIDGDLLLDKLRELELGITTQEVTIEQTTIDHTWFLGL